jgi:hypothetical protein
MAISQCGTPIEGYLCKFCGHSSSLQEFVTVGINLGTSKSNCESLSTLPGPPREILQGGTRLLWGPRDRLRLPSKLRILGSIKPLVNFM